MSTTAAAAPSASTEDQTQSTTTRITKDGRKITYQLTVVQQPQRARACGQGAKSSSDRRPVDPPPVVELKVLEGDDKNEITFSYDTSFFLFATLESARATAPGRGLHSQANNAVLTGAPAVGISYLERPVPAGYFIFPDLSVRHEGAFRLNFSLFESMKNAQDIDANAQSSETVGSHFHPRCEVKSTTFHVYSAKKFPGLTESTLLSRVVADQGCRVRIRRDVRMRRRDSKAEKEWDTTEEAPTTEGARADMGAYDTKYNIASPAAQQYQPQNELVDKFESAPSSTSTQTLQAPQQQGQQVSQVMQPTGFQYPQWYQYPASLQQTPQQIYAPHAPTEQTYVPRQHYQTGFTTPQSTHQQPQQMTPTAQYPGAYSYQQTGPGAMMQNGSLAYQQHNANQQQQSQQMSPMYSQQQQSYSQTQMRPQSAGYTTNYGTSDRDAQNNLQYGYQQPHSMSYPQPQQSQQSLEPTTQPPNPLAIGKPLPPLEVPRVSHTSTDIMSPLNATALHKPNGVGMGPLSFSSLTQHMPGLNNHPSMARPPPPQLLSSAGAGLGQKRSYGSTFDTMHTQEAMRNGARPNAEAVPDWGEQADEDLQDLESIKMTYRRADGSYTVVSPRGYGVH